jgi:cytochrome c55X
LARLVAGLLVLACSFIFPNISMAADTTDVAAYVPSAARRGELIALVRQDCGSCHGLTLKGGLGPALLPDALAGKATDSLTATIMQGRPGTAMPPWHRFLSEQEAQWIVANLQKGFPVER